VTFLDVKEGCVHCAVEINKRYTLQKTDAILFYPSSSQLLALLYHLSFIFVVK